MGWRRPFEMFGVIEGRNYDTHARRFLFFRRCCLHGSLGAEQRSGSPVLISVLVREMLNGKRGADFVFPAYYRRVTRKSGLLQCFRNNSQLIIAVGPRTFKTQFWLCAGHVKRAPFD